MYEQHLAHLFNISLNCKESRQTGTQPITIFRIFAENLTLNILLNYEEIFIGEIRLLDKFVVYHFPCSIRVFS